ncbi:hypothetical protein AALO_G00223690 [Alosa alosa]|uniref:Uncharacterized protein n=1 Tax=Alosa alosa TaxID=278164 RepID=A0AAV6FXR3_9TELE|nr:hypothetical protein AALO_G00223690 [Alosa alosa]
MSTTVGPTNSPSSRWAVWEAIRGVIKWSFVSERPDSLLRVAGCGRQLGLDGCL